MVSPAQPATPKLIIRGDDDEALRAAGIWRPLRIPHLADIVVPATPPAFARHRFTGVAGLAGPYTPAAPPAHPPQD